MYKKTSIKKFNNYTDSDTRDSDDYKVLSLVKIKTLSMTEKAEEDWKWLRVQ